MIEAINDKEQSNETPLIHQMERRLIELIAEASRQESFGQINLTAYMEAGKLTFVKVGFEETMK